MKAEPEFDLIRCLQEIHRRGIDCLLIGRWAVAQHGAPVVTADYDFWVDPKERARLFALLFEVFDAELPSGDQLDKPIATIYVGPDKIDCFSARKMVNADGQALIFSEVYERSVEKRDKEADLTFRVPCIDDLIALKKFPSQDPVKHARNLEDIRYLKTLKK
jgi:hypothetical protein